MGEKKYKQLVNPFNHKQFHYQQELFLEYLWLLPT